MASNYQHYDAPSTTEPAGMPEEVFSKSKTGAEKTDEQMAHWWLQEEPPQSFSELMPSDSDQAGIPDAPLMAPQPEAEPASSMPGAKPPVDWFAMTFGKVDPTSVNASSPPNDGDEGEAIVMAEQSKAYAPPSQSADSFNLYANYSGASMHRSDQNPPEDPNAQPAVPGDDHAFGQYFQPTATAMSQEEAVQPHDKADIPRPYISVDVIKSCEKVDVPKPHDNADAAKSHEKVDDIKLEEAVEVDIPPPAEMTLRLRMTPSSELISTSIDKESESVVSQGTGAPALADDEMAGIQQCSRCQFMGNPMQANFCLLCGQQLRARPDVHVLLDKLHLSSSVSSSASDRNLASPPHNVPPPIIPSQHGPTISIASPTYQEKRPSSAPRTHPVMSFGVGGVLYATTPVYQVRFQQGHHVEKYVPGSVQVRKLPSSKTEPSGKLGGDLLLGLKAKELRPHITAIEDDPLLRDVLTLALEGGPLSAKKHDVRVCQLLLNGHVHLSDDSSVALSFGGAALRATIMGVPDASGPGSSRDYVGALLVSLLRGNRGGIAQALGSLAINELSPRDPLRLFLLCHALSINSANSVNSMNTSMHPSNPINPSSASGDIDLALEAQHFTGQWRQLLLMLYSNVAPMHPSVLQSLVNNVHIQEEDRTMAENNARLIMAVVLNVDPPPIIGASRHGPLYEAIRHVHDATYVCGPLLASKVATAEHLAYDQGDLAMTKRYLAQLLSVLGTLRPKSDSLLPAPLMLRLKRLQERTQHLFATTTTAPSTSSGGVSAIGGGGGMWKGLLDAFDRFAGVSESVPSASISAVAPAPSINMPSPPSIQEPFNDHGRSGYVAAASHSYSWHSHDPTSQVAISQADSSLLMASQLHTVQHEAPPSSQYAATSSEYIPYASHQLADSQSPYDYYGGYVYGHQQSQAPSTIVNSQAEQHETKDSYAWYSASTTGPQSHGGAEALPDTVEPIITIEGIAASGEGQERQMEAPPQAVSPEADQLTSSPDQMPAAPSYYQFSSYYAPPSSHSDPVPSPQSKQSDSRPKAGGDDDWGFGNVADATAQGTAKSSAGSRPETKLTAASPSSSTGSAAGSGGVLGFIKKILPLKAASPSPSSSGTADKKGSQANLGLQSNFYYDQQLKRWIARGEEDSLTTHQPPPPPPRTSPPLPPAQNSSGTYRVPLSPSSSSLGYTSSANMLPPLSASNASTDGNMTADGLARPKKLKSKYVDPFAMPDAPLAQPLVPPTQPPMPYPSNHPPPMPSQPVSIQPASGQPQPGSTIKSPYAAYKTAHASANEPVAF